MRRISHSTLFGLILGVWAGAVSSAEYQVTFSGTWSADDITLPYPSGAHFTELVGTTHAQGNSLWQSGATASKGVENVAELGSNGTIRNEILAQQEMDLAGPYISIGSLFNLPNSSMLTIEVSEDKPYISLISMIAPSSDWFVGVSGLSLLDDKETWIPSLKVNLPPWDAGTEDGDIFSLGNPATEPQGVITPLSGVPFVGRPSLGTLEFTLISPIVTPPPTPPTPAPPTTGSAMPLLPAVMSLLLN